MAVSALHPLQDVAVVIGERHRNASVLLSRFYRPESMGRTVTASQMG